jgi:hypothetical protein
MSRYRINYFLFLTFFGGDSIELVVGRVRGGRGIERDAEVERESGQDRLAGGLVPIVQLAIEERLFADDDALRGNWYCRHDLRRRRAGHARVELAVRYEVSGNRMRPNAESRVLDGRRAVGQRY